VNPGVAVRRGTLGPPELALAGTVLLCATAITAGVGFLKVSTALQPLLLVSGTAALLASAALSLRGERDWFNPLLLIIATWFLRIGLPALWLAFEPPPAEFIVMFHLSREHWEQGLALALVGMAAISLGWLIFPHFTRRLGQATVARIERTFRMDARTFLVALAFILLGIVCIVVFLRMNFSSSSDAIATGAIRKSGRQREGGTSRYSFFAVALITYGSLAASTYLLVLRRSSWRLGMLPALAGTVVMSIFGGRVLALTPTAYALLVFWYRSDRRHIGTARVALVGVLGTLFFGFYSIFIAYYRVGFGFKAAGKVLSIDGLARYLSHTLWYEAGMLHPYAVATVFPPGVLKGASLPATLGFAGTLAGINGVRPGAFMVESFFGNNPLHNWGWHTGLVIDTYMNYGLAAVVVVGIAFGMVLRTVHAGFRFAPRDPVVIALYVMLVWHFFWMFYEHTAATLNILTISFPFLLLVVVTARLLPARVSGTPQPRSLAGVPG
jgi:hypothetical protein